MTEVLDAAYYVENPEQFEALTEAEQDAIFNGGIDAEVSGDDEISEDDLNLVLEGDAIESKDHKHTIPYDELKSARQLAHEAKAERDQLQALADQQAQLIADLQEAKNQDAVTGGTSAQDELTDSLREEFGEILGDNFEAYLEQVINKAVKPFKEKAEQADLILKNIENERQRELDIKAEADWNKRVKVFEDAHPKWKEINASPEFNAWFDSLPDFQKQAAQTFNPENHKFILDSFVKQSGLKATNTQASEEPKATTSKIPTTLSSVTGKAGEQSAGERYMSMSKDQQAAYLDKLGDNPDAIEKLIEEVKRLQS